MKTKDKVAFPKPAPTIELKGIKAELMSDFDRYSDGHIMMSITNCPVHHKKKEVGSVNFAVNGTAVGITVGKRTYSIDCEQLFAAVMVADEQQRKNEDAK